MEVLSKNEKDLVKKRIESVIKGTEEKVNFNDILLSANVLIDILTDDFHAEIDISEMDTNGWQMDFWIPVEINGESYDIEGSGYYRTLSFYKE
ncbi:hypothetical protein [Enterococcus sp. 5H]|uniref:hypothetical protein n=1 Tax=Enterococcus sp. 5H TaxID=1229490 RepID=UPI0023027F2E|nr:hypothetical protein [Enterococcus sp. 5H]